MNTYLTSLLIISFFFILTIVGFTTIAIFVIDNTERYWRGFYRMGIYVYQRFIGTPKQNAFSIAFRH